MFWVCLFRWVGRDEEPASEENVTFFRELLAKHASGSSLWRHFIRKISALDSATLYSNGLAMSDKLELPQGFGAFLLDLGLEPMGRSTSDRPGKAGNGPARGAPASISGAFPGCENDHVKWQQAESHYLLRLDTAALQKAVRLGPARRSHRVFLSPTTLVVAPPELIEHWRDQIYWHTRQGTLRVAVYHGRSETSLSLFLHAHAEFPHSCHRIIPPLCFALLCRFFSLFFIQFAVRADSSKSIPVAPLPQTLAWEYDVVLTSFGVMSREWNPSTPLTCSPLSQVHWLRIIVDEGHTLGTLGMTNKLQMATFLRAERRWCMTGTPAPSGPGVGAITLRYMQPLLSFLHDEVLGTPHGFQELIDKPLKVCPVAARWRLMRTLLRCMVRASKSELRSLPELRRHIVGLEFEPSHAVSYNTLVDLVRFNLLTSDWYDPDHRESLLAVSNAARATAFLFNVAQACNVAGSCELQVTAADLHDCLELIVAHHPTGYAAPGPLHLGPPFFPETHPLAHIEDGLRGGGSCKKCGVVVRVLFATPCACLLCVACTAEDKERCACCGTAYLMQPRSDPARRKENPNPKWAVPQQLIEFQPAFAQLGAVGAAEGYWQAQWMDTDSTKCAYLISRLKEVGVLPRKPFHDAVWGCSHPATASDASGAALQPPLKAIVFTQFWHHALLLEKTLERAAPATFFALYRKQMTQHEKASSLKRFRVDPGCRVLLMDESGALGLDLSFVSFVFLMEPVENRSLEEQVVSRAHRMGATTESVTVEVVAMRGSLEEERLRLRGEALDCWRSRRSSNGPEKEGSVGGHASGSGEGVGSGSGAMQLGSSLQQEQWRQEAAKRAERNAILQSLRPVKAGSAAPVGNAGVRADV